jgi:hypothetical protein
MKVFKGIVAFWNLHINVLNIKHGCFWQSVIDESRIWELQNYRMAAAFATPILITVEQVDKNYQACIRKIIDECEAVLKDESLYIIAGRGNPKLSQKLRDAVEKARDAVAHVGNLSNELMCRLENQVPEKIMALITRVRDRCNQAIRIKHFS